MHLTALICSMVSLFLALLDLSWFKEKWPFFLPNSESVNSSLQWNQLTNQTALFPISESVSQSARITDRFTDSAINWPTSALFSPYVFCNKSNQPSVGRKIMIYWNLSNKNHMPCMTKASIIFADRNVVTGVAAVPSNQPSIHNVH